MSSTSPAEDVARRLLTAAALTREGTRDGGRSSVHDPVVAAERAAEELAHVLARWFGPYGTHALLTRALGQARRGHPALETAHLGAPLAPALGRLAEAAALHGPGAVTEGVLALLAASVTLLGRMIGEDMALQLVERRMEGHPPSVPDGDPERVPDQPPVAAPPITDAPSTGGGA
jgi:hypothetical protein